MLERIRKLIERYSRVSAEHSTAATMNDEFSKGVCSVVDGVVADLKKVERDMSKLKLFKCTFEVDTGVNYNKKVKYIFANNESECYDKALELYNDDVEVYFNKIKIYILTRRCLLCMNY